MKIEGKVALITGAASGIGYAIAQCYLEAGGRVVIADLNEEGATSAAKKLAGANAAIGVGMDVSKEDQVNAGVERAVQAFGTVDILVSNAGIQIVHPVEEFPFAEEDAGDPSRRCLPGHQSLHQAYVQAGIGLAHLYGLSAQPMRLRR